MSEANENAAPVDGLPPGFFEKVEPYLQLCSMGCLQFFSRPHDPLPQEITELTGLDKADAHQMTYIDSNETLARQLTEDPEQFYAYLVIGELVLAGPLAASVLDYLQEAGNLDAEYMDVIRNSLLPFGASFTEIVGNFAAQDDEEVREELQLLRLQIEGAFARLADTLRPVEVQVPPATPAPEPAATAGEQDAEVDDEEEVDEDDEPMLEVRFRVEQAHMLRLALSLVKALPTLTEHPFAQAAANLSACSLADLDDATEHLESADPDTPTPLSWRDLATLYQSTQVLAMVIVSNVLDALHWEENLMAYQDTYETQEELTEAFARTQQAICMMVAGFVECVQQALPEDEELARLREEVAALADLI